MMASYSATKAAVRMLVRGWGQELGEHGINVNAIGPGYFKTELTKALWADEAFEVGPPANRLQVIEAGLLAGEALHELGDVHDGGNRDSVLVVRHRGPP